MPILEVTSQKSPKDLSAFIKRLSAVFAEHIGKPEAVCLVTFTKADDVCFAGSNNPAYLVRVGGIDVISEERNTNVTKAVTHILDEELGIPNDRGFVLFNEYPSANIGFKDTTFRSILKK
ncbi:Tautomerase/MIF superfamily [Halteromyces radiatus]|uniref:Tautomerase/MIF superfamily n=1 Tax=Halteromyces radiatus TaxID=101107 RepID=UPI002221269E|nr:Tautomerase/MIF superfamily [Halteromyces radiatus]KAI8078741.1 Tautomerase/MIF superfamily [Halteromyces radiatus]